MSQRSSEGRLGYAPRLKGHPIQIVVRRTGLSADVIRAWEKRYAVVAPTRSESGRRLYSDADVERLRLLARATLTGRSIGLVAALPNAALAELAAQGDAAGAAATSSAAPPALDHLGACLAAVERFDEASLDAALRHAVIALSAEAFLDSLVVPLWERVEARVREARVRGAALRAAHRHLTLAALRGVLHRVTDAAPPAAGAPRLLVTIASRLADASPEMGALLTAAAAVADGWLVTVAGPALSAEDVADLTAALGARAVAVSLGAAAADRAAPRELRRLRALLPPGVALLLEGAAAAAHRALARELDTSAVRDLPALRTRLRALRVAGA